MGSVPCAVSLVVPADLRLQAHALETALRNPCYDHCFSLRLTGRLLGSGYQYLDTRNKPHKLRRTLLYATGKTSKKALFLHSINFSYH